MRLEDLPGELWFVILSYLSPMEAFYAFNKVSNSRIHSILTDMYSIQRDDDVNCSSVLNISLVHVPLFMYKFAVSEVISFYSNIIHALTLSNERTPGQIESFLIKYSFKYDFPYLKRLRLIQPSSNELNLIINDLSNVQMLDIQSKEMHTFDIHTIQKVLYSKPSIEHCFLSQFRTDFISSASHSSLLRKLAIGSCDYLCLVNILNHFPSLHSLSIDTLSMSRDVTLPSIQLMNRPLGIRNCKLRAFSVPFDYLQILLPYFENIQIFSLAVIYDEGFDYVNSQRWQLIISNYWPLLQKFQIYSELWHLSPLDIDELYPQLWLFRNNAFWIDRRLHFVIDFYQEKDEFHLIFYSSPYPNRTFSNQWGYPVDTVFSLTNTKDASLTKHTYRQVHRLLLTTYDNKQMETDLETVSRHFPNVETLTIRFEEPISSGLFSIYISELINVNCVKHIVLNGRCHTIGTLHRLVRRLPNLTKLTITSNHHKLTKQLFHPRNKDLLAILSNRLQHFDLLHDGVTTYETIQLIRYHFLHLRSFSACVPHFEVFRDAIPSFIHDMKSLHYLHVGLEADHEKKSFGTQNMYHWFQRHHIVQDLKLSIDTYTNSIHIWL